MLDFQVRTSESLAEIELSFPSAVCPEQLQETRPETQISPDQHGLEELAYPNASKLGTDSDLIAPDSGEPSADPKPDNLEAKTEEGDTIARNLEPAEEIQISPEPAQKVQEDSGSVESGAGEVRLIEGLLSNSASDPGEEISGVYVMNLFSSSPMLWRNKLVCFPVTSFSG